MGCGDSALWQLDTPVEVCHPRRIEPYHVILNLIQDPPWSGVWMPDQVRHDVAGAPSGWMPDRVRHDVITCSCKCVRQRLARRTDREQSSPGQKSPAAEMPDIWMPDIWHHPPSSLRGPSAARGNPDRRGGDCFVADSSQRPLHPAGMTVCSCVNSSTALNYRRIEQAAVCLPRDALLSCVSPNFAHFRAPRACSRGDEGPAPTRSSECQTHTWSNWERTGGAGICSAPSRFCVR